VERRSSSARAIRRSSHAATGSPSPGAARSGCGTRGSEARRSPRSAAASAA
jgi:hypothetical protein